MLSTHSETASDGQGETNIVDIEIRQIAVAQQILAKDGSDIPVIICSADASEWLREAVSDADYSFIRKPIKSLALRKLIMKQLNSSTI